MTPRCPHCHKPLVGTRAGVLMSALRAKLFDAIDAAGDVGVTAREIMATVYAGRKPPESIAVIRNHIWVINKLLDGTDRRICCRDRRWTVVVVPRRERRASEKATAPAAEG